MMNKNWKKIHLLPVFLILSIALFSSGQEEEAQGVLAPETSNEARLNRLQPPDEVMDAEGIDQGLVIAGIDAEKGRYVVQLAVPVHQIRNMIPVDFKYFDRKNRNLDKMSDISF